MGSERITRRLGDYLQGVIDNRGKTPPNDTARTEYELLEVNCLTGSGRRPNYEVVRKFVTKETYDSWFRNGHPKKNDVIISTVGSIGEVCISEGRGSIAQNLIALSPKSDVLAGEFLYYYLSSQEVKNALLALNISSVQPSIKVPHLLDLEISVLPLPEQKRIAHILGSLDDKIELNRRMNATLEGMAQALFKSWFVDFDPVIDNALVAGNSIPDEFADRAEIRRQALADGTANREAAKSFPAAFQQTEAMGWIPEGWKEAKLNDLLDVKYGKDHKNLAEGVIPVYGSGGLMRYADKALYSGESVLIPRKGTLSNILYLNKKFWTVDTMFYTTPKCKYVLKYAFYHLKSLDFASLNVGSAVPSMTTKVLNALQIVMPTESVLHNFDSVLASYFDRAEANNMQSKMLSKLRDTLLPKLISGELRIVDTENMVEGVEKLSNIRRSSEND